MTGRIRLVALAAGAAHSASIQRRMAAARPIGWARAGVDAGARWYCLRSGLWLAGNIWALRNDHTAAGLCPVRTQPHHGPGTGLGTGTHHPQCRASIVRWGRRTRCRVGRHDGYRFRDDVHPGRLGAPRLRYRTSFKAHTVRLHERNCADGIDQPTPALFGFSVESDGLVKRIRAIAQAIFEGKTNWTAFLIGTGTLAVILLLKGSKRLPGTLIAVVAATAVVAALDLAARSEVAVLGPLPQGYRRSRSPGLSRPTSSQC